MKEFNFKKKFGQNFLIDEMVKEKIINSIHPTKDDLIIEIGTGIGFLTKELVNFESKYIGFEIDTETKPYLQKYENDKNKFIFQDFLKVNLNDIISTFNYHNIYIIGNLPYYITTPIIEKLIDSKIHLASLTIMVQKEVAERFISKPGSKSYGYFTVILNYFFNIEKITDVNRKCFKPIPNVDSTVLKLIKKTYNENFDYESFKVFLKRAFQFKRKTLKNNLKGYDLSKIQDTLGKYNLDLSSRAENIDLEIFIDLFNNL